MLRMVSTFLVMPRNRSLDPTGQSHFAGADRSWERDAAMLTHRLRSAPATADSAGHGLLFWRLRVDSSRGCAQRSVISRKPAAISGVALALVHGLAPPVCRV
jgi:hypothetical protein